MKEKTLEDFIKEKASEITGLPIESMFMDENLDKDTRNWIDICTRYADHVKAIALQEGRNETEWINVDKGLPQVGHKNQVLIYCPQREFDFDPKVITGWMENSYGNNVWCSMHGHSEEFLNPSHWKPLPHPPSK